MGSYTESRGSVVHSKVVKNSEESTVVPIVSSKSDNIRMILSNELLELVKAHNTENELVKINIKFKI